MSEVKELVLVVEDDSALCDMIREELGDAGFEVCQALDVVGAMEQLNARSVDLLLSDVRLPGADGSSLLAYVQTLEAPPAVIMMTAFGTVSQAVEALRQGAADFLTKPLDLDHLLIAVRRSLETRRLRRDIQRYRAMLNVDDFHGMAGQSAQMQQLFSMIRRIGPAPGPVLIAGESGTGKDLVARALHRESPRAHKPFVAVNCAGIPAELQESEFFGHLAGAFTGAQRNRRGLFAEADGGTLFLDEIGEMPLELQAKLLRILQDGAVRPLGADREQYLDVRIIGATNLDLEEAVSQGRFREDLYYRLETFGIQVPPLRERAEDLELLCVRFIELIAARMGRPVPDMNDEFLQYMRQYDFPGNVRELRNALERAMVFSLDGSLRVEGLPERIRRASQSLDARRQILLRELGAEHLPGLEEFGNQYIRYVLERVDGNKRRAAQILGMSRATLYRRLEIQ